MVHNNDKHEKTCTKDRFCPVVDNVDDCDGGSCTIPCWNSCHNCSTMRKQQQAVERTVSVIETSHQALYELWQKLAQRNQWMLVDDEDVFIEQVAAEYANVPNARTVRERQEIAVKRAYGVYLYNGVQKRQDRAFYELGLAFVRFALKDKSSHVEAEELAHATLQAILEKIDTVKSPPSFLSWVYTVFRTVRQKARKSTNNENPFPTNDQGEMMYEVPDPRESTIEVEQQMGAQQVLLLLRAAVPDDRACQVIWKTIVDNDSTREVAQDLDISEQAVRTIKHRTLKRLEKNVELRVQLQKLADMPNADSGVTHEKQ